MLRLVNCREKVVFVTVFRGDSLLLNCKIMPIARATSQMTGSNLDIQGQLENFVCLTTTKH